MFATLVLSAMGAFWNRFRGSGEPDCKAISALVFGLCAASVSPYWWVAITASLAMYVGQAPGWGRYIGALGLWEDKELKEFAPVDFFIKNIKADYEKTGYDGYKFAWGFFGLTLRGLFWGAMLALGTMHWAPLAAGALMGIVYFVCMAAASCLDTSDEDWQGKSWEMSEIAFGAVLWGSLTI